MEALLEKTVAEIVAANYKAADVFKKYGIDFCCGGNVGLSEICKRKQINLTEIEKDLQSVAGKKDDSHDFDRWELDFLIDYIINQHHSYVSENIPFIIQYSDKVEKALLLLIRNKSQSSLSDFCDRFRYIFRLFKKKSKKYYLNRETNI